MSAPLAKRQAGHNKVDNHYTDFKHSPTGVPKFSQV